MSEDTISKYLDGMREAEILLGSYGFQRLSFQRKGYLCIDKFTKQGTVVKFLFGPPEWHPEMFIQTQTGRFSLKDLLEIPVVMDWYRDKLDRQKDDLSARDELLWFVELLKVALAFIE
jgi:hypothetical protein